MDHVLVEFVHIFIYFYHVYHLIYYHLIIVVRQCSSILFPNLCPVPENA